MKSILTWLCFSVGLVAADIVYLDSASFDAEAHKHTVLFANFFNPQCVHSQELDPKFSQAEATVAPLKLPVSFAKVNCDGRGRELCERFDVKAYPVIKVFNFGEFVFNYEGPKEAASMVKFLRFKLEPGSQRLDGLEDLSACVATFDNVVVGFFQTPQSGLERTFQQLAEALKAEYKFAHTYSGKLMNTFGFRDEVVLIRSDKLKTSLEQSRLRFEGQPSLYNLRNWVASTYQGLTGFRTKANIEHFKAPLVVAYFHVDFESTTSTSHYYRNRMMMVARKVKRLDSGERVTFAVSDLKEFKRHLEDWGVAEVPAARDAVVVTLMDALGRKFLFDRNVPFSSEAVEKFVRDSLGGRLAPFVRSQEAPSTEEDESSHVLTAVGTTFEAMVLDSKADVLVQLLAPWSSDCRAALQLLKKLASKLKEEALRVVMIDVTANEVPRPFVLRGYPSIYLAKRHQKDKPIFYEGGHSLKEYMSFVAANTTVPLKKYDRSGKKLTSSTTPSPKNIEL